MLYERVYKGRGIPTVGVPYWAVPRISITGVLLRVLFGRFLQPGFCVVWEYNKKGIPHNVDFTLVDPPAIVKSRCRNTIV